MKKILVTWFLIGVGFLVAQATEVSFYDAVEQKKISFTAEGKGGYHGEALQLQIINLLPVPVKFKIEAGTQFDSQHDWTQNLMVVQDLIVSLVPKERSALSVYTVCIQAHNSSPPSGEKFTLLPKAKGELLRLAQIASEKKYFHYSTVQSAVWAITDNEAIENVYGTDSAMLAAIIEPICSARGVRPSDFNFMPRAHRISSISTALECLLPDYVPNAALRAYDQNGRLVRTFWQGQTLKPGFYQFKVGINHYDGDSATFQLRLESGNNVVVQKVAAITDTIIPVRRLDKETIVTYDLSQETVARVAVYDSADNLYALVADNYKLTKGFHQSILQGARDLPEGITYYLKITEVPTGKVVISKKIIFNEQERKKYPLLTKRGSVQVELKNPVKDAKLAIYDAEDRIVWVAFDNSQLSHGVKTYNYVFQHDYGEQAKFTAKITDGQGNIITEKCVQGCAKNK